MPFCVAEQCAVSPPLGALTMQAFLVLVVLGWLISLPWVSIILWVLGLLIVSLVLCGVAGYVIKSRQEATRADPLIDAEYLAALESLLAQAEAEGRMLRADTGASCTPTGTRPIAKTRRSADTNRPSTCSIR